jgi:hypothetical protein
MSTTLEVLDGPQQREAGTTSRQLRRPSLRAVLLGLLVLMDVAVPAVLAWRSSLTVPTYHLDGAFQTASGLFRLSEGDVPGRDFYPYLGIGPLLVLFPLFAVMGGELTDSVFAAYFVTLLSAQLLVAVLVSLLLRRRSLLVFALAATVPVVVLVVVRTWAGYTGVEPACGNCLSLMAYAAEPGNSLRPVRAIAPYLLAAVAMAALLGHWRRRTSMIVLGVASGLIAALWSNDYGLVSAALMVALVTGIEVLRRRGRWMRSLLLLWGTAAGAFLVAGFAATAGSFIPYVKYNLVDVRGDQFWYFGAWDEPYKVFSPGDLVRLMRAEDALLGVLVLAAVGVAAYRRRSVHWLLVGYLGTATLMGGAIATIGGHSAYYFWAFRVWALVVLAVGLLLLVRRELLLHRPSLADRLQRSSGVLRRAVVVVTVAVLLATSMLAIRDAVRTQTALASDSRYVVDEELGGYLDAEFADQVELARENEDEAVEEYFGLLGSVDGPNPDLAVDAVIHGLGAQREAFAEHMATGPETVVSTAPEASDGWAAWNLTANWWFYEDLFRSYTPERTSPMTLVWTRTEPVTWDSVPCAINGYRVELSARTSGLYEVDLQYRGPGRNSRSFSMVGTNLELPGTSSFMALDPGATSQAFPVYVHDPRAGVTSLAMKDVPATNGQRVTELTGCTARAIEVPEGADTFDVFGGVMRANDTLPYWGTPANASFRKWKDGINTEYAAVLLPRTEKNLTRVLAAETVRFGNGDIRTIQDIVVTSSFINVTLDGEVLEPEVAAHPQPFWLGTGDES